MGGESQSTAKGCAIVVAVLLLVPLLVLGIVGVRTWIPLQRAQESLDALELRLGPGASYTPAPSGGIPPDRLELFLELRATLATACQRYGTVQEAFETVESLDSSRAEPEEIATVARVLGSAALEITPFLANFFELRNAALLTASMGLEEYVYIYAVAYREQLLSERTRAEIFSGGDALSPEASGILIGCLTRQLDAMGQADVEARDLTAVEAEIQRMDSDPTRLIWQDGLPHAVRTSLAPCQDQIDRLFCAATAGLEMERSSLRALRLALE